MQRIPRLLFGFVFVLASSAADFWTAKPYTEWTDKEAAKLLSNSPWAHSVAVSGGDLGGVRAAVPGIKAPTPTASPQAGVVPAMDAQGTLPDGTRRPGDPTPNSSLSADTVRAVVRWQSALPVKQALLVRKGRSDLTSPEDAKRILEAPESHYIIAMSGLR